VGARFLHSACNGGRFAPPPPVSYVTDCRPALSAFYVYKPRLWSSSFSIYLRSQIKCSARLVERQVIKVLARPTNTAEQICGQRKGGALRCEHITKFCVGLHEIFGFHWFNLSSFVICFNMVEAILFLQTINLH